MKSRPARLLAVVLALAVIAHARVALLPGWVVPVPAVFLAVAVIAAGMLAALIVLRSRLDRMPLVPGGGPGTAAEVK